MNKKYNNSSQSDNSTNEIPFIGFCEEDLDDFYEHFYDEEDFEEVIEDDEFCEEDFEYFAEEDEFYDNFDDDGFVPFAESPEQVTEAFNNSDLFLAKNRTRPLNDFVSHLNNNIMTVGTSGCGKTTSFIEPNLVDPQGCYVLSDPKGTLLKKYGERLKAFGYNVIVMDFQHPEKSVRWNPMMNLKSTQDILRFSNAIIFDPRAISKTDPFWDNANLLYCNALIGYMLETDYKPMNVRSLNQLMAEGGRFSRRREVNGVRQYNEKASALSDRFEELHRKKPYSWAYEQFKAVDQSTEKTYDSIRITLASKFANFSSRELEIMMSGNDIDFEKIAQERTAVFVLQSDTDRSMDGLVNLFFSQAINSLISYADTCPNQRLPIPVRFFLDDYGATTAIDNLDTIISTIRSRAISVSLILQSESQLVCSKPGADKTILANCDTYIYMGGNDVETAMSVSQRCNKPLEQILYMPVGHCWVFERGKKPVYAEISDRPDIDEIERKRIECSKGIA